MAKAKKAAKPKKAAKAKSTAHKPHQDDHIDACDLDFHADPTHDADLPPARGGVEGERASRRR